MLVGADASNIVINHIDASERSAYPPGFHVQLVQESDEAVRLEHEQLTDAGLTPTTISGPCEAGGARWTAFCCPLGDGREIEIDHPTRSDLLDS